MDRVAMMLENEEENYDSALEYGFVKGKQQGERNGIQKRNFEIAKKLLSKTNDYNYISEITELPIKKIKQLQKSL